MPYTGLPQGPYASGATQVHVSDRLYPYGFALDFCYGQVDGTSDNAACLQNALNALGVNFHSLEIQPSVISPGGQANLTSTVYNTGRALIWSKFFEAEGKTFGPVRLIVRTNTDLFEFQAE